MTHVLHAAKFSLHCFLFKESPLHPYLIKKCKADSPVLWIPGYQ
jgi:hypothetical protein